MSRYQCQKDMQRLQIWKPGCVVSLLSVAPNPSFQVLICEVGLGCTNCTPPLPTESIVGSSRTGRNEPGERPGTKAPKQRTPQQRNTLSHMTQAVLGTRPLSKETPSWGWGGLCLFAAILWVNHGSNSWVHVPTQVRVISFTFNLPRKLDRNELHPPGFLCSVQLRKAIS